MTPTRSAAATASRDEEIKTPQQDDDEAEPTEPTDDQTERAADRRR